MHEAAFAGAPGERPVGSHCGPMMYVFKIPKAAPIMS
jgi:hypothetical protein